MASPTAAATCSAAPAAAEPAALSPAGPARPTSPAARAAATAADPRWAAVLARDRQADGRFVFAVRSTGVYCRPSCPSRRARPEQVSFHPDAAAAQRAGYRACLRCQPDQGSAAAGPSAWVADLCRFIAAAEQPPTLAALAARTGRSAAHLHRVFKAVTGLTPKAYGDAHRAQRLRAALADSPSVTDAVYRAGYQAGSRFYAEADALLGMTPTRWRAGGAGVEIRFAVGQCSLGAILVASSARGVCAVALGDAPDPLVRDLQQRFPRADLVGDDAGHAQWVARVLGWVEAPGLGLDLPLDLRGTAFQQRVWQALRAIPAGSTASYAGIAARIGAPKAQRAVAAACAANPVALLVPCHRVLRSDGALSGYRWGVARKQALLEREAEVAGLAGTAGMADTAERTASANAQAGPQPINLTRRPAD